MIGVPICAVLHSRFDKLLPLFLLCVLNWMMMIFLFYLMQCVTLVDYYVPLFFIQLESFQPQDFCKRMNLCDKVAALVEEARQDSCAVCHKTVSDILIKLQDPDTQVST